MVGEGLESDRGPQGEHKGAQRLWPGLSNYLGLMSHARMLYPHEIIEFVFHLYVPVCMMCKYAHGTQLMSGGQRTTL